MKKTDFIIILAALLVAVVLKFTFFSGEKGAVVVVYVDGEEYARLPLDENAVLEIKTDDGHINALSVENGKANMTDADCPDQYCVKQGEISYYGEKIVCLPHKVVAQIEGGKKSAADAISASFSSRLCISA